MINNYTTLVAAVADWMHRSDLNAVIPQFIQLAEERLNHDLAARSMIITDSISTVAGQKLLDLPTDILEVSRVQVAASPIRVLTPMSADEIASKHPFDSAGMPANYAILGNKIQLGPVPDGVYQLEITYRQKLPSLLSNTDNWLIIDSPSCYLWACLMAAATYIKDGDMYQFVLSQYQEAVEKLNRADWCTVSTPRVSAR